MTKEEIVEAVSVPDGVSVNVVIAIPFLDVNPIAGSEYVAVVVGVVDVNVGSVIAKARIYEYFYWK